MSIKSKAETTEPTLAEMKAMLEAAQAENEQLKAKEKAGLTLALTQKGCVNLKGLRKRFGVIFYAEEWLTIFDMAEQVKAFIEENKDKLKYRGEEPETYAARMVKAGLTHTVPRSKD